MCIFTTDSQFQQHSLQKTLWLPPKISLTMAICY